MISTVEMKGNLLRELSADRAKWLAPDLLDSAPRGYTPAALMERVELHRLDASRRLDPGRRQQLGQFLTPAPVAALMAGMFALNDADSVTVLDAGAGVGSLTAALVAELCSRDRRPSSVSVTAYEIDPALTGYLDQTHYECEAVCREAGIDFVAQIIQSDFVAAGAEMIRGGFFGPERQSFNCVVMNPPYRKINSDSADRHHLRAIGMETSNLYTGFLAIGMHLLEMGGELVAITPRSFCNGPYFKPFREWFLKEMTPFRFHVFESRTTAFQDDEVLQENIIFHAAKGAPRSRKVFITTSSGPLDDDYTMREVDPDQLVRPDDPGRFIHLAPDEISHRVAERMQSLQHSLRDLGISVSTGRVVDFRAREYLRATPEPGTVPLIHPAHFDGGFIAWPRTNGRKPNAIAVAPYTEDQLVPAGVYVLTKRFTSKEERRRIVAAVYDPARVSTEHVGFENHLNYFHAGGAGLPFVLAKGLAAYLNSSLLDAYFRQFNGHTQVNATDLRSLRYPSHDDLERLGSRIGEQFPDQREIDRYVEEELFSMTEDAGGLDPVRARERINEAREILKDLGFPRAQLNDRSALTLLALLDLTPTASWQDTADPLRGITQMMDFFARNYGVTYAPNSRETVRRSTVHQFLEAGLVVINPDEPERPTNSGLTVYQIEAGALELLRTYGTAEWDVSLRTYLASRETLVRRYAAERTMRRIPIRLPDGREFTLSPGGQNVLVEQVINEFCPRFTPGGRVLYVGDTDEKFIVFARAELAGLGITVEEHGKMPDVIVFQEDKNWLVVIEAVTSHGPVNPKRQGELTAIFGGSHASLVFVTAFLDRNSMTRYLPEIAWETEVWVADHPTHLIHFNGERLLGP